MESGKNVRKSSGGFEMCCISYLFFILLVYFFNKKGKVESFIDGLKLM